MLVRHFRGVIRDGAEDRLLGRLNDNFLPRLEGNPAVLAATLSIPLEVGKPREFLMETYWRSLRELIRFAGNDWRAPLWNPPWRSAWRQSSLITTSQWGSPQGRWPAWRRRRRSCGSTPWGSPGRAARWAG